MRRSRTKLLSAAAAALALFLGMAIAGTAQADVVWLCLPGAADNPCAGGMETTVTAPDGATRVETPAVPADPPVDCFYVYPTVSEDPGTNADKGRDAPVVAIAKHQAARFSQVCRVFAPIYRQQTLLALGAGGSPAAQQKAYGDVAEAFGDYLVNHNRGRGFVLIGHSQGAKMLRQLIRKEIEPRPELLPRMISAVLLGGNVVVRRGEPTGGDFRQVLACRAPGQTGCVIAYSTFNETPPPDSRFGRVSQDTSGFGFPSGPEYEVLCTNPASLLANERAPLESILRSERLPGFLGVLMVQMYGGPPPSAPTPWLVPQDRYTGRCELRDGANVLMVEPVGLARRLNPAPDDTWGLHLADVNLALGNLVAVVRQQAEAFLPAFVVLRPDLVLKSRCRRGRARVSVVGPERRGVHSVRFRLGKRLVARDRRAPFRKLMRRGARGRLRAVVVMRDGRRAVYSRTLRRCH